ncbi:MAG: hypothetical protein JST92_04855 [Deltaproteobacteria bacterium]|nr:hypothetical protein [Deltaproteobacteria bacterium]
MALRDNPILKQLMQTGEERMSKLAASVLSNEKVMGALQKAVSTGLTAKGLIESNVQSVLSTMNVPTAADVQKLEGKIEELEQVFEGLTARIADLQDKAKAHVEAAVAPAAASAPAAHAAAPVAPVAAAPVAAAPVAPVAAAPSAPAPAPAAPAHVNGHEAPKP